MATILSAQSTDVGVNRHQDPVPEYRRPEDYLAVPEEECRPTSTPPGLPPEDEGPARMAQRLVDAYTARGPARSPTSSRSPGCSQDRQHRASKLLAEIARRDPDAGMAVDTTRRPRRGEAGAHPHGSKEAERIEQDSSP